MATRSIFLLFAAASLTACFSGPSLGLHVDAPTLGAEIVVPAGYFAHQTIDCSGTDDIRLENAYIETVGTAIRATDACTITLVHSQIISRAGVALVADGAGDINLVDCVVDGAHGAIKVTGAGDVNAQGSTIIGAIRTGEAGDFNPSADTVVRSH
ncbi:MAG: hypothetical protein EP329_13695 [Deltaproteobacteria bacterium]|nr:MAG: hypothetical protein EP329_13695 [Deltaproteobacteria bacterium]